MSRTINNIMANLRISKERILMQQDVKRVNDNKLAPGTKLTIMDILQGSYMQNGIEVSNDMMRLVDDNGSVYELSLRQYLKMRSKKDLYRSKDNDPESNTVYFPNSITILTSEDEVWDGVKVYTKGAYNGVKEYFESDGQMGMDELMETGLKPDHTFDPKQIYTVDIG